MRDTPTDTTPPWPPALVELRDGSLAFNPAAIAAAVPVGRNGDEDDEDDDDEQAGTA